VGFDGHELSFRIRKGNIQKAARNNSIKRTRINQPVGQYNRIQELGLYVVLTWLLSLVLVSHLLFRSGQEMAHISHRYCGAFESFRNADSPTEQS
jgi:hypothetical protein